MERERLTLRAWRRRRLLTQEQLAERTGMDQYTISRLETGQSEPRVSTLAKLCRALAIEPDQLVIERSTSAGRPGRKPSARTSETEGAAA